VGLAVAYVAKGQEYVFLPKFFKHQHPPRPTPSLHPRPSPEILTEFPEYVQGRAAAFNAPSSRHREIFDADGWPATPAAVMTGHDSSCRVMDSSPPDEDGVGVKEEERHEPAADLPFVFDGELIKGGGPPWPVTRTLYDRLREAHPDLDVLAELHKAAAWLEANPRRRKTPRGMSRFVAGWCNRAAERKTEKSAAKAALPYLPGVSP